MPETLVELYREAFRRHARPDAFLRKVDGAYRPVPSADVDARVQRVAAALVTRGLAPGDRVGLLSENRLEWILADLGILTAGAADVPIYSTLPAGQAGYILADSGARFAFVSTRDQMEKVLSIAATLPALEALVVFDLPAGAGVGKTVPFDDFLAEGEAALARNPELASRRGDAVRATDLATIIYTSGTTGRPKGVMLTHANIAINARDALADFPIGASDRALSALPLSHIFERTGGYYCLLARGASIAYAESVDMIPQNLLEVRPTLMLFAPRLFEKIYRRVMDTALASSAPRRALYLRARAVAWEWARRKSAHRSIPLRLALEHALFDRLAYAALRSRVGGRIRFFISGGAPLNADIAEFFLGVGLPVLEGYGLTETSPVIAVNRLDRNRPGTVGPLIRGVEVRIADDGEILVRGPSVMQGYYHLPEDTARALEGGWFHTGDIGQLEEGFLRITGRKKDLIVNAGGKKIAPQPIEDALKSIPLFAEAVLIGDRRPYVTALLVPNFDRLEAWARESGVIFESRADLVAHRRVQEHCARLVADATRELAQFEKIKRFTLLDRDFTLTDGELTPTLKVKRGEIARLYSAAIERMYEGHTV